MERGPRGPETDILLVEDNPGDVRLTREAFGEAGIENEIRHVSRGSAALDYLHQREEYADVERPGIVLLDLNLPGMSGIEVLNEVKGSAELRDTPVIVLSSSEDREDVARCYEEYANAYMTKPVDGDEFVDIARSVGNFWIRTVKLPASDY